LKKILDEIEAKKQKDIAIFGKPLSNKRGKDKAESKKRAIKLTQRSLDKIEEDLNRKFKLSARDSKVLDSIRNGTNIGNTTADDKGSRYDNRWNGSANSRRNAKIYHRRWKQ
jgi:hypothetical protein